MLKPEQWKDMDDAVKAHEWLSIVGPAYENKLNEAWRYFNWLRDIREAAGDDLRDASCRMDFKDVEKYFKTRMKEALEYLLILEKLPLSQPAPLPGNASSNESASQQ
ncbi:MAG: hypothetical protein Q4B58_03955 [Bacteroidales bacterium]|nr:hypothetical protein [Bacteroidales bacterium]